MGMRDYGMSDKWSNRRVMAQRLVSLPMFPRLTSRYRGHSPLTSIRR